MYICVQQVEDRTKGKAQPGKKRGYYFNYVMSQKANFSKNKLDGQGEATKAKKSQGGKAGTP